MGRKTPHCIEEHRHPHVRQKRATKAVPRPKLKIGYACKPIEKEEGPTGSLLMVLETAGFRVAHIHAKGGPIEICPDTKERLLAITSGRAAIVGEGQTKKIDAGAWVMIPVNASYTINPDPETLFQLDVISPR